VSNFATRRLVLRAGATLIASTVLLSGAAHAEPSSAELDRQIRTKSEQLEVVVERYHELREDLRTTAAQTGVLQRQIEPLKEQIRQRRGAVGRLAAAGYRSTRSMSLSLLLDAGTTRDIVDRLLLMKSYTQHQQREIDTLALTCERYATARRTLDALLEQQKKQHKQLGRQRATIEASIDELKALRVKAYGPTGRLAHAPGRAQVPVPKLAGASEKVLKFAMAQIGKDYQWAGEGPGGFDCSGLVAAAFRKIGVQLPHHSGRQQQRARAISRGELVPGDLVFFYRDLHHVGIYLGDDKMVHAPQFGERVRTDPIDSLPINSFGRVVLSTP
jgi:cell wall-associated NlpC family hydrolase